MAVIHMLILLCGLSGAWSQTACTEIARCMSQHMVETANQKMSQGDLKGFCELMIPGMKCAEEAFNDCKASGSMPAEHIQAAEQQLGSYKAMEGTCSAAAGGAGGAMAGGEMGTGGVAGGPYECTDIMTCSSMGDPEAMGQAFQNMDFKTGCKHLIPMVTCTQQAYNDCKAKGLLSQMPAEAMKQIEESMNPDNPQMKICAPYMGGAASGGEAGAEAGGAAGAGGKDTMVVNPDEEKGSVSYETYVFPENPKCSDFMKCSMPIKDVMTLDASVCKVLSKVEMCMTKSRDACVDNQAAAKSTANTALKMVKGKREQCVPILEEAAKQEGNAPAGTTQKPNNAVSTLHASVLTLAAALTGAVWGRLH